MNKPLKINQIDARRLAHAGMWQTKPSDRFILRWIKVHLSARITPHLFAWSGIEPWMITLLSSGLGVLGGTVFALGWGWLAGCIAACAQVFDGVDGQLARISGKQSKGGAFWDSVLDRYADGAMMIGLVVYLVRLPSSWPNWLILVLGTLALIGSNLVSYSSARAENLSIDLGKPTLASKGTRTSVMILCAWGSLIWTGLPILALLYLAVHPNAVIARRLLLTSYITQPEADRGEKV
ncbi:MAG: CDP-alcohol phosphatidyltransferase family protein [Desulforhabdus sp.]|nr:CDP-alcohol phosphatidyltransferase family protein [Desulforhabdus sp.]